MTNDADTRSSGSSLRNLLSHPAAMWVPAGILLFMAGVASNRFPSAPVVARAVPQVAGVAIVAVALLFAWNRPARRTMLGWLLPRFVAAIVAGAVLVTAALAPPPWLGTEPPPSPKQACAETRTDYGALMYVRLRGDTMVCVYYGGGGASL